MPLYRGYYKNGERIWVVIDTTTGHPINAFKDKYEAEDFADEYWEQTRRDCGIYPVDLH